MLRSLWCGAGVDSRCKSSSKLSCCAFFTLQVQHDTLLSQQHSPFTSIMLHGSITYEIPKSQTCQTSLISRQQPHCLTNPTLVTRRRGLPGFLGFRQTRFGHLTPRIKILDESTLSVVWCWCWRAFFGCANPRDLECTHRHSTAWQTSTISRWWVSQNIRNCSAGQLESTQVR